LTSTLHRAVQRARTRADEVQPVAPLIPGHDLRRMAPTRHTRPRRPL
jgi:hypothetical protein